MRMVSAYPPWQPPPHELTLDPLEVHVWRADVDDAVSSVGDLESVLSADETARARRFRFTKDRRRYVVRRGLLRRILSRYLGIPPDRLRFTYNPNGKPELSSEHGRRVRFNASHSDGMALYAVVRDRRVGIDVERSPTSVDIMEIAERFFAPREVAVLTGLPSEARNDAFLAAWTGKEAYVKAVGLGLSSGLSEVEIAVTGAASARIRRIGESRAEAAKWSLQQLVPGPSYLAAVVVDGHGWRLRSLEFGCEATVS